MENKNILWTEKHRPNKLEDVISHQNIIGILKSLVSQKKLFNVIFYGPSGTGKTSTITACAKELYGEKDMQLMVMELNASDDRGIDVVRNRIKQFVSTKNISESKVKFKLVILDEIDAMTDDAQGVLKTIIDTYNYNVRFCLICNYINKINPVLLSRCLKFQFPPLPKVHVVQKIKDICKTENVTINDEAIELFLKVVRGDLRKLINMIQSLNSHQTEITRDSLLIYFNYPSEEFINKFFQYMQGELDIKTAYNSIRKAKDQKNISMQDILLELCDRIHDLVRKTDDKRDINKYMTILHNLKKLDTDNCNSISENIQLAALLAYLN